MTPQQSEAVALLEEMRRPTGKSQERRQQLLLDPTVAGSPHWCFHLPPEFWPALDLAKTEVIESVQGVRHVDKRWTQGSNFAFQIGDTIYDSPSAYAMPWGEALKVISRFVKISFAASARGESREKISDAPPLYTYFPRVCGDVAFEVWQVQAGRPVLAERIRGSQDDFVRFLITGIYAPAPLLAALTKVTDTVPA